jgi:hypothetical protein
MAKNRKIEWQYLTAFFIGILIWMFIGVPALNWITAKYSVVIAYPIFLVGYAFLFYVLGYGITHEKAATFMLIFIAVFFFQDIYSPPILVPLAGATALTPEQSLASDVFLYTIFHSFLPHFAAWFMTYIIVPIAVLFLLIFVLSGKRLDQIVRRL